MAYRKRQIRLSGLLLALIQCLRAATYYQPTPVSYPAWIKIPPFGTTFAILCYAAFILALEFIENNVEGIQFWQARGIRAGWLAVAQMPLIILLVARINWISFLTSISYERLNIIHRWAARLMLLLAIFHFAFQAHGWAQYPGIFHLEWTTDECIPTGLAAFILLVWVNFSTVAPIRNFYYELFVVQHILTWFGFVIAIMYHLPTTALGTRVYIWIPIALYLADRLLRTARYIYINLRSTKAELTRLSGGATRVQIHKPRIKSWTPGSHVLISIPSLAFGQSHPATIVSSPQSHAGDIVLLLKSHSSFTKRLLAAGSSLDEAKEVSETEHSRRVLIDGPYGGKQADFSAFDSVLLIAGSTGVTFILSLLHGLCSAAKEADGKMPLKRVHVVWAVKELVCLDWALKDMETALQELKGLGPEAVVSFYVSNDDTAEPSPLGALTTTPTYTELASTGKETFSPGNAANHTIQLGRPPIESILDGTLQQSNASLGVTICGPLAMSVRVRKAVSAAVSTNLKRDLYLHVEGFAY